jgi:hemerythrin-like domain-containing protein
MTTQDTPTAIPVSRRQPAAAGRVDLYAGIHKALRLFMADTLARVGRLDAEDADERAATLAQVDELLGQFRSHVDKENRYVHAALEARCAGASADIAAEHVEHLEAIAALEAEVVALRALPTPAAAFRLYRRLARFVGENLAHMDVEETALNAALWAAYSDAELMDVHHRILAAIDPQEMARVLRWMVPAMTPAERAEMLSAMPPAARDAALAIVRPHLDDGAWARLTRALGLPPVPGLVTV